MRHALSLAVVLAAASAAWGQDDFYYPGKRVWAENSAGLHSKARVSKVTGSRVEVEFFKHHTLESLESLVDLGPAVERRVIDRSSLDWWNQPRYEVIVPWKGRLWPKGQVTRQLGPDAFEVQVFDGDGNPAEKITVSRQDLLRNNVFTYPKDGESVGGIKMDYGDADVQAAVRKLNAITDKYAPLIQAETNPARKADIQKQLARELFVEYKGLGIEHDGNLTPQDSPTAGERRAIASRDPNPRSLGSYIRSKVGVCTEQAYVFWGLMARSGAVEKAGLDWMPYSTVHSEVRVRFGADGSNWNQDLTASRGQPVPGRNFESLSTSGGKSWEVMFQKGSVGLGYSSGISVDRPYDVARGVPGNLALTNPARGVKLDLTGGGAQDRATVGSRVRGEIAGAGQFAAAYLIKEGLNAIETGDPQRMKEAVGQLKTPEFWGGVAAFTGAARATEFGLSKLPLTGVAKGFSKAALPLAAGMAAVQLLSGQASLKDIAIDTGAYLAAGLAVGLAADAFIYPLLFAAGPPGWIAAGLYTVGKLAVTLYLGDKLSGWLRGLFGGKDEAKPRAPAQGGIKSKIEAINP